MHISGPRAGIALAFARRSSFGSSKRRTTFHASRPYGTCDGVCATKSDHYVSHVDHACHFCSLPIRRRLRGGRAIHLSLRCGPTTEQADKSSWTLDATRCFRDSTEQLEEHVQDMHECRRTFLFAPYALVRSNSMWKQREWHQPQHSSPNVWCRLHCETATERLPTGMSNNNYALGESAAGIISPISETATEHRPNGAILCEDCDEADHSVLCHATGHAHMVHAARIGSVLPFG